MKKRILPFITGFALAALAFACKTTNPEGARHQSGAGAGGTYGPLANGGSLNVPGFEFTGQTHTCQTVRFTKAYSPVTNLQGLRPLLVYGPNHSTNLQIGPYTNTEGHGYVRFFAKQADNLGLDVGIMLKQNFSPYRSNCVAIPILGEVSLTVALTNSFNNNKNTYLLTLFSKETLTESRFIKYYWYYTNRGPATFPLDEDEPARAESKN